MNAAELKLDLFRRLDNLDNSKLEKVYSKIINLINTDAPYKLSEAEKASVNEAFENNNEEKYSQKEVMDEARRKYPNLNFK